ncbi:MAG: transcription-repair coupling factor [Desulfovibrio sp.]|nr:transcription-repair coupling factor [Desulfovibrio sp.]
MQELFPFETRDDVLHIDRSGQATQARLAAEAAARGRTAVLVARNRDDFAQLSALAQLFTPSLSSGPAGDGTPVWGRGVVQLPQGLLLRRDGSAWAQRMAALYALSFEAPRIVVASVESLLLRYPPRRFFEKASLDVAKGAEWPQELLLEQLLDWGYERVPLVTRTGEIARRGDILDIFAPGYPRPLRLEFFGDSVEDLKVFDPDSQRSLASLAEATFVPASPWLGDAESRKAQIQRICQLYDRGELTENMAYDCRKSLESGQCRVMPGMVYEDASRFEDWLPEGSLFFMAGESDLADDVRTAYAGLAEALASEDADFVQPSVLCLRETVRMPWDRGHTACFFEPMVMGVETAGLELRERGVHSFQEFFPKPEDMDRPWLAVSSAIRAWARDRRQVVLSFASDRSRRKFLKLAEPDGILPRLKYAFREKGVFALVSPFRHGAELAWDGTVVLGESILFPKAEKVPRSPSRAFKGMDSFEDLKDGELLVHRDYGIGRFRGLKRIDAGGVANDFLLVEYQGRDNLYVPVDRLALIQRFQGAEGAEPALDRLGASAWSTCKEKARKAIEQIAADLVEMYAYRKVAKGFRYPPAGELYREFESTFGYEETPDQARAIEDVLADMERPEPMDRLVCGDVGFGKTEVAMRAAFRAASEGRQVALLCPTTVLAEQHYQTFRARMNGFPLNVALLSRFVPADRQREVVSQASKGLVDILIGTHRILSSDVSLPNLGLLVLDEEQRFGVRHKENLKALKKNVDVLTLTATPIPRTLQLSMSGIRDLSIIETAPADRKPVASAVIERDDAVLRKVLERELAREGQVFWVYNRVQGLARVAEYVHRLVPQARIGMAHGRMNEDEVEGNMHKFWHGELDVLVCTSLVESGLDFPRANTLVVDQAQNFGLGQLYQLRGRVGRSDRQAYAFFVVPDRSHMTELSAERLRIIMDLDYLGAGFKVAMEDLRLRGAGNILGEAQSGHITRVGLDLYLEMLEQAVERLKGTPQARQVETEVNIAVPARIPETYIEDGRERLRAYKQLTGAQDGASSEEAALAVRDRFGPFPEEFRNFLAVLDFKRFLSGLQVEKADLGPKAVRLSWAEGQTGADPVKILRLASQTHGARLTPPASLSMPLAQDKPFPEALSLLRGLLEGVRSGADEPDPKAEASGPAPDPAAPAERPDKAPRGPRRRGRPRIVVGEGLQGGLDEAGQREEAAAGASKAGRRSRRSAAFAWKP